METAIKHSLDDRASVETIKQQHQLIQNYIWIRTLYEATIDMILIVNKQRQIVYANQVLLDTLAVNNIEKILGLRPGEALNCVHSIDCGCGNSIFCQECGAKQALMNSRSNDYGIQECRITQNKSGDAFDFLVKATSLDLENEQFSVFTLRDIGSEKRNRVLERIFFHDVLNTAATIKSLAEVIKMAKRKDIKQFEEKIISATSRLIEEIESQRDLLAAENHELASNITSIDSVEIIKDLTDLYRSQKLYEDKCIRLDDHCHSITFQTDKRLLSRVIGNMIKNALEACEANMTITVGCDSENGRISFWVHNPTYIPEKAQLQIFNRSFSTKGKGRGLGTYSMKLLSEQYLKGNVYFTSSEQEGTTFTASYPINYN